MTRAEAEATIRELIPYARAAAEPNGPHHAIWDDIFDAEDFIRGRHGIYGAGRSEERVAAVIIANLKHHKH